MYIFLLIFAVSLAIIFFIDNRLTNTRELEREKSVDNNITTEVSQQKQEDISFPTISGLPEEENSEGDENAYDVIAEKFTRGDAIAITYPSIKGLSDSTSFLFNLVASEIYHKETIFCIY